MWVLNDATAHYVEMFDRTKNYLWQVIFNLLLQSDFLLNLLLNGHKMRLSGIVGPSVVRNFGSAHRTCVVVFEPDIDAMLMKEVIAWELSHYIFVLIVVHANDATLIFDHFLLIFKLGEGVMREMGQDGLHVIQSVIDKERDERPIQKAA